MRTLHLTLLIVLNLPLLLLAQKKEGNPAASTSGTKKNGGSSITTVGDAVVRNAAGTMVRGSSIPKQPFKIYTNPAQELLIVEYASADFKDGDIKVSDIKGKLIKQVNLEGNLTKLNLNTANWKNGAYTIVLSQYSTHQTVMQTIYLSR
ncbi:MAG: T9SS type A sorting domain-containing protein [Bacteroidetes bacterium]|nr:T9SS type A sorting domain-containing protein [Bacteroidota bacterium]MBK9673082.1 T9SS type A sorting domain-containing protein [Bacteroidota bacterium]MBK9799627.1 T9SS type A sorting domain-containing protein [Bacteroidota bacterium]MBP6412359.1 T9SS type A sorting domain-containing protein [Bacteroidia bacterium]